MKNYIIYLISIFAVSLLLSCDRGGEIEIENNTLELILSCNNLGITRATDQGVDALGENAIESIDCFFYKADEVFTFNSSAIKHKRVTSLTDFAPGAYKASISFSEDEFKEIFGNLKETNTGDSCFIYVIANLNLSNESLPDTLSINKLKALTIESDFLHYTTPQESFVMDSKGDSINGVNSVFLTVDSEKDKRTLFGVVPLYRTAAKISLTISKFGPDAFSDTIFIKNVKYVPVYDDIRVEFHNGVEKSHIAPDIVPNSDVEYFRTGLDDMNLIRTKIGDYDSVSCVLKSPFYSYPFDWSDNEAYDAYISLVVPWRSVSATGGTPPTSYYYKVPINYRADELVRNTHYKINVQISMLGTLDPDSTVILDPSYVVFDCIDWNNDTISTTITDFRYLMVEENSYVLNNVDKIEIPYWSSHPCKIVGAKITQADIKTGGDKTISNPELYITLEDDKIIYSKVLDNNYMSKTFDFTPYTIEFTIQHNTTDSTKYQEKITITQYPAIYGDYEVNSEYIDEESNNNASHYTMVNGYYGKKNSSSSANDQEGLENQDFFASCGGLFEGFSPNMYVFTITSVEGTNYVIGDPRTTEIDTVLINAKRKYENPVGNNGDAWVTAKALYNGAQNRKLQYYYPTDVDYTSDETMKNSRTENMIAPKFRMASGYAVLYTSNDNDHPTRDIEGMKKRCASYQEDGYPAGRWRLPTKAEFEFIFGQVRAKKLPPIYNEDADYWCAHGIGHCNKGSSTVTLTYKTTSYSGLSVRCVYDDWYWGSEPVLTTDDKSTFTWGDIPRSAKADAPAIKY